MLRAAASLVRNQGASLPVLLHRGNPKRHYAARSLHFAAAPAVTTTATKSSGDAASGSSPSLLAAAFTATAIAAATATAATTRCETERSPHEAFELGPILGQGAFGVVHLATSKKTGEKTAIKEMDKKHVHDKSFQREVDALRRIHELGGHANIAGLRDIFEDADKYYLVMELVSGGELFDHLVEHGAYSEQTAAALMRDVGRAFAFLHGHAMVHADIKPESPPFFFFLSLGARRRAKRRGDPRG